MQELLLERDTSLSLWLAAQLLLPTQPTCDVQRALLQSSNHRAIFSAQEGAAPSLSNFLL